MEQKFLVRVRCITYNHASYITDALDGFCMQETTFPFVCTIVDDASTDGEQEVLKKYIQEHFDIGRPSISIQEETDEYVMTFARHKTNQNCFFAVYYLKYNHYSIKKSKAPYFREWSNKAKYVALCEGDDYWINPQKLQIQTAYMESHPECTMTCNRTKLFSIRSDQYIGEQYCRRKGGLLDPVDVINRTGLYISTCSIVYRSSITAGYPEYCKQCKVGDYPLQIIAAMKGNVYYFDEVMSVYRVENSESWMGRQKRGSIANKVSVIDSQIAMFKGFSISYPLYKHVFEEKIACRINWGIPSSNYPHEIQSQYLSYFDDYIKNYSFYWKMDLWIRKNLTSFFCSIYIVLFMRKYRSLRKVYLNSVCSFYGSMFKMEKKQKNKKKIEI